MIKQQLFNLCIGILLLLPAQSLAAEPDWSSYTQLLERHVSPSYKNNIKLNLVDYQNLARDRHWPNILSTLATFDERLLSTKEEKLAFWINAYNVLAIKVVLDHWPLDSIRDAGGFFFPVWKKPTAIVAEKMRSLHEIEHLVLRPMGEPRIHFAIVCASVSCPDLKTEAYEAEHLEDQLNQQARAFINHPHKGVNRQKNALHISKIFDWFEEDFQHHGDVLGFIKNNRKEIPKHAHISAYLDYDWSLNSKTIAATP